MRKISVSLSSKTARLYSSPKDKKPYCASNFLFGQSFPPSYRNVVSVRLLSSLIPFISQNIWGTVHGGIQGRTPNGKEIPTLLALSADPTKPTAPGIRSSVTMQAGDPKGGGTLMPL